ncbi:Protein of unknown function DUF361 [Methanocaldococcus vulcanius M7]|uniref:Flagellin n=1 Tax=Methanocaldococcus vulcanius (strain ATCC 700851 / DSM 12094 / M7) TaxID=579137 RepID=C9REJ8_METVM|nr:class III signal peptide-containing protein [Methanocaldococcus vulcanius]ACX72000.1 Protein of unknown function DUF361 [Methanocaldococcus vulcanius M7]
MFRFRKRGQISLEFSLLFLGVLVALIVAVGYPGMFGLKKTVEISSMSLAHAAVSKMKQTIDLVEIADEGTVRTVYIKSPPGTWGANGNILYLYRDSGGIKYNITAKCNINLKILGNATVPYAKIITVEVKKVNSSQVNITIS